MRTLQNLAADLNNMGVYVRAGNGVIHVGITSEKTYALGIDDVYSASYLNIKMPAKIKRVITEWANGR